MKKGTLRLKHPPVVIEVPAGVTANGETSEDGDFLVLEDSTPGLNVPYLMRKKHVEEYYILDSEKPSVVWNPSSPITIGGGSLGPYKYDYDPRNNPCIHQYQSLPGSIFRTCTICGFYEKLIVTCNTNTTS